MLRTGRKRRQTELRKQVVDGANEENKMNKVEFGVGWQVSKQAGRQACFGVRSMKVRMFSEGMALSWPN